MRLTQIAKSAALIFAVTTSSNIMAESRKTYEDFIDVLWTFESSIDSSKQAYYDINWNTEVVDSYPKVTFPGRVVRDPNTGKPIQEEHLTIKEYFTSIGIADLYDPKQPTHDWKKIQAAVTNYLGFIGFQFQESDLQVLGYYNFETESIHGQTYPKHYVDVPVTHWEHGVTEYLETDPEVVAKPTVVTDTVRYVDENFTGKHGISSVADFKNPDKHIFIIKDHFVNKHNGIKTGLAKFGKTIDDFLGTEVTWDGLNPPVTPPPGGRSNNVVITMSGLLAGAHLRGAEGVVSMLIYGKNPADESGTYLLQYVQDYAGYDTPFDKNQ
ncbi:hypothetical protein [Vibrio sp. 10N.261.55.A7]|uniref:hypothetical protein n=1 Tax=Vibrio sp. 10N.261.55.A7 TaxID=1880851 RepID=UPI000C845A0F|nr:hypothetical protein [Vibrio sp. 10N.261.55.A7]